MQCAVIEYARNVCGLMTPIVRNLPGNALPGHRFNAEQKEVKDKGGTMRLGSYPCKLEPGSKAHLAYGKQLIKERHRHRYEFNNQFGPCSQSGIRSPGFTDGRLVEIVEIPDHPWFVGCQFHPEFQSRPNRAHLCSEILWGCPKAFAAVLRINMDSWRGFCWRLRTA